MSAQRLCAHLQAQRARLSVPDASKKLEDGL